MPKRKQTTISLLPEIKTKLKRVAENTDTTQSRVIETAIAKIKEPAKDKE